LTATAIAYGTQRKLPVIFSVIFERFIVWYQCWQFDGN